ncbi:MAG: hypothetical protein J6Z11_01950, partial [Candidatus Riflebacteria bacterium]|nr:hypothetical protein [Candidatus Riflebacteria bacterium]
MNKEANKNFNIVKSLLFWTGAIICFVLFPIFLLDIGLQSYINTKNEIEEREAYRKLGLSIEKILQYNDAKHYYHSLLKKIFDIAESQSSPVDYLKVAIPHLKERNPGIFNFIVWNSENEEIIENLTDENEHRYVLKSLKEVFKTVSDENNKKYPV